jgi:hypothetical protein
VSQQRVAVHEEQIAAKPLQNATEIVEEGVDRLFKQRLRRNGGDKFGHGCLCEGSNLLGPWGWRTYSLGKPLASGDDAPTAAILHIRTLQIMSAAEELPPLEPLPQDDGPFPVVSIAYTASGTRFCRCNVRIEAASRENGVTMQPRTRLGCCVPSSLRKKRLSEH